jgi:hypothetical protein
MSRDSQIAQEPLPVRHPTSRASRWLIVAVGLCGALAGGSIVETIAALASGSSISVSPGHLIAEPLALAGALSGGLLAAILASKDHGSGRSADQMIANSLAPADIVPSEPMLWQPAPHILPTNMTLTASSMPPARTKHRMRYAHRRIRSHVSHFRQTRPTISRSVAIINTPRHP